MAYVASNDRQLSSLPVARLWAVFHSPCGFQESLPVDTMPIICLSLDHSQLLLLGVCMRVFILRQTWKMVSLLFLQLLSRPSPPLHSRSLYDNVLVSPVPQVLFTSSCFSYSVLQTECFPLPYFQLPDSILCPLRSLTEVWRDSSMVKTTDCYSRGRRFNFQHKHGVLQGCL